MLVVMKPHASEAEIAAVVERIASLGLAAHPIPGAQRVAIGITGNKGGLEPEPSRRHARRRRTRIRVSQPFKLVSREVKEEDTVIDVGGVPLGGHGARRHGGAVLGRVARADPRGGARGEGRRRALPARRRLQAAHQPLRVPGARPRRG